MAEGGKGGAEGGTPVIRRATEEDWPRILTILKFANYHHIGGSEMESFPLEDCFVAEVGGVVAGVAGYRILTDREAKTTLMVVDPAFRSLGLGIYLQKARMDFLRARGIEFLTTNCDDPKVMDWYARHFGYAPTGAKVPKTESFGLDHVSEWTTIRCRL